MSSKARRVVVVVPSPEYLLALFAAFLMRVAMAFISLSSWVNGGLRTRWT